MPFKRWLPNVLMALLGVAILYTFLLGQAFAAPPYGCTPLPFLLDRITADSNFSVLRVLQGKKLSILSKFYNSTPPEADIAWTSGYLAIRKDGYGILMVGFDGSVCERAFLDAAATRTLLILMDGHSI